jgi:hypothetical protein
LYNYSLECLLSRKRENVGAKIAKQQRQRKQAEKRAKKLARKQGKPVPKEGQWI